MKRKIIAAVCAAAVAVPLSVPMLGANAAYKESDLKTAANSAIKWKDENDSPFYSIGSNGSDLYITALKRLGKSYDYGTYLSGLDGIAAGYDAEHNASDMARTALAIIASGGEPRSIAGRDMVADGTYFRDAAAPLGREGVDGFSWALIALDAGDYEIPDWAIRDRNNIIDGILSHQNTDGSFDGSVYSTAAAVTALAPYDKSGAYTVIQNQTGWTVDISPKEAVEKALDYLSDTQTKDGDWGNLISTAMSVIAIDSAGLDPDSDSRFAARSGTALDGLMSYKNSDGGFAQDEKRSDGEATSYAICALASHLLSMQNKSRLFKLNADDAVSFDAAATATPSTSSSSSSTNRSTSSSSSTRATTTPRATTSPTNTLRPTKTTTPRASASPMPSTIPTPTATPRPTKRPDLVGPVQMPGPMQPTDPPELGGNEGDTKHAPVGPIIATVIALAVIAALILLLYLKNSGKLQKKNTRPSELYKAKRHRRTEEHRRCEQREKYKQRLKYKNKSI